MPIIKPQPQPLPVYVPDQANIDAIKATITAVALNGNTLQFTKQPEPVVQTSDRQTLEQQIANIQSAMDEYILARQAEIDERTALIQLCQDNGVFDPMPTPENVAGVDVTVSGGNDGQITGVDNTMEYRNANDASYTSITGTTITDLVSGQYFVRTAATDGFKASGDVQIIINEPLPPVMEPPVKL